jgi:tetratricopeptide (TPR) repeat protein
MDFLDDLRDQQEPKPQDKRPKSAASIEPNTQDQEAWNELLVNVKFEEENAPIEERGLTRRRAGRAGLSSSQKIILGILAVAAICLWTVVALALTGSLPASIAGLTRQDGAPPTAATPPLSEAIPTEPASDESAPPAPTEISPVEIAGETPATAAPTTTPIPRGPVATAYDERLRNDPTNIELYLQRGHEFLRVGAFDAALQDFSRALELDDARAEAHEGIGWANYYLFHWGAAGEAFDITIALDEALHGAHFGLGLMHYYRGSYRNASREFDWAAEINPLHAEYEAWLAMAAAQLGDKVEAEGAATRAINLTTESSLVYVARSWARRIEAPSDFDGAQGDLLYARNLAPNDFLTLNALAEFYLENRPERLGEAEQLATYALNWAANDVEEAVALHTLGRIYLQQGRKNDALNVLESAVDLASREGEVLIAGLEESLAAARD